MHIAVLGAGAIGGSVGALLAENGHDVTLVGRSDQVRAIRESGLQLEGSLGAFTAKVRAATTLDGIPDLALLAVKTQDVEATVRSSESLLHDVPLVTLQNGVRSDEIVARILPPNKLLSAVVMVTATYLVPGHVTLVDRGHLVLGRPRGPRDTLSEEIAGVLNPAVPTYLSDNLIGAHWVKLIMNLNNALPALSNRALREVSDDPLLRELAVRLMREGVRVAERGGVVLEPLGGVSLRTVRLLTRLPVSWAAGMFGARAGRVGGGWPVLGSTLQSVRRGRPTEVDYLNGEVVAQGARLGIPTPFNAKVVELVHEVERTGRFPTPERLRDEFTAIRGR
ncbi:MAG TPA: 2-dehydropantoate 2-reductase [Thermoplasmata archaeon]|nr:2-dehydropantoate 2-reductase [Thermoplasmata archaeon]